MNRNYSISERRKKGKVHVSKLFSTYSKGLKVKEVIYFDEETKIQLSKDFLMFTLVHQCSPIELINSMIKKVSYAEFVARYDLKEEEHNPAISFFIRVMDGYGVYRIGLTSNHTLSRSFFCGMCRSFELAIFSIVSLKIGLTYTVNDWKKIMNKSIKTYFKYDKFGKD